MYNIVHIDPNGCKEDVGEYHSEEEARFAAKDWFRSYCSLDEQIEHFMHVFSLQPETPISEVVTILHAMNDQSYSEVDSYCEDYNDNTKDAIVIYGPNCFEVVYWADISYDNEHGFYYEIDCNG